MQFIYTVFDKLVLMFSILVFVGVMMFAQKQAVIDFSIHAADILIGALVGLITGALLKSQSTTTTTTKTLAGSPDDMPSDRLEKANDSEGVK